MRLSILIPTYNYNARALVEAMLSLARAEEVDAEVIVGDDGSSQHTRWMDELFPGEPLRVAVPTLKGSSGNLMRFPAEPHEVPMELREVATEQPSGAASPEAHSAPPRLRLLRSPENIGRAAIRNRLAAAARGRWLLFVDCDAQVPPSFSLRNYLLTAAPDGDAAAPAHAVVSGGLLNPTAEPAPGCELRWSYEQEAQGRFAASRLNRQEKVPFRTFSFLILRDLFLRVGFDETIRRYGYEDVLFGIALERLGQRPYYIDNPLLNGDIEPNDVFLAKTEEALRTLHTIPGGLHGYSPLENAALRLRRLHLAAPVRQLFRLLRRPLRRHLLGPRPGLRRFAFYKLGYFLDLGPQAT